MVDTFFPVLYARGSPSLEAGGGGSACRHEGGQVQEVGPHRASVLPCVAALVVRLGTPGDP